MNKQSLIQKVQESEMTDHLKKALVKEFSNFPDELSDEDKINAIKLLKAIQTEELATAADLDAAADQLDNLVDNLDHAEDQFVVTHIKSIKNTLQNLETGIN
jgi:hypothetical protein